MLDQRILSSVKEECKFLLFMCQNVYDVSP